MLDQSWPDFLDLLDSDRDAAFKAFYSFAYRLMTVKAPRSFRCLEEDESADVIQEIVLHCIRNDFRVLRKYVDRGKPFAAWLYMLANNKCRDILRKKKRDADVQSTVSKSDGSNPVSLGPDKDIDPGQRAELRDILKEVGSCVSRLGQYCQLLLQLAADEYTPSEMILVLGWPRDRNKKVSDDLRQCRNRLRKAMAEQGIDLAAVLQL